MKPSTCLAPLVALALAPAAAAQQLVPRDGSAPIGVRSHRVDALVEDGLARTTVRHTFVNPGARPLEAVYLFPLPDGAALVGVAMEVGGERHEGLLAERMRARRTYDEIVRREKDPALVENVGDGMFRLSVFPVVPHEETVVEISWIEHLPLQNGAFRYVYRLAQAGQAVTTERDFTATVTLRSAVPFARVSCSADDAQVVQRSAGETVVALERVGARLDRDLVVTGTVTAREPSVAVRTLRKEAGDGWFQVVITPPAAACDQLLARDVVLVLDTSGSMKAGGKMEQARASALWLLDNLRPVDRVNVLRFSSDVQAFAESLVPASPERLAELRAFVAGFEAAGSTALGDALQRAVAVFEDAGAPENAGRVRTVVLLTDGRPTLGVQDPAALIGFARLGAERGLRLFPFGVGADVDAGLLRGVATAGRGTAEIFRPGGEIEARLTRFLTRTAAPVLAELSLEVEGAEVYDVFPRPLPDAYLGEQVTITGRFRGGAAGRVSVGADLGDARAVLSSEHDFGAAGGEQSVAYLFARQKLEHLGLAQRLRLGLADDAYYAALDRGAYSTADEIVDEMISVSLVHGVQCAYTSFLVLLPEDRARMEGLAAGRELGIEEERVEFENAPAFTSDSPFDSDTFQDVIGVGGGAGGKFGGRFGGRRNLRAAGGAGIEQALKDGLEWLKNHQQPEGRWEDVGTTGLALLAFLGDGNTTNEGPYRDVVVRAVTWLRDRQDPSTGMFAASVQEHVVASLAVCEAYYFSKSPRLKATAAAAVSAVVRAQDSAGGWAGSELGDVALTCWAIQALGSAKEAGLHVEEEALAAAARFLDAAGGSDPGAALLARILLGQDPRSVPALAPPLEELASRAADAGSRGCTLDLVLEVYAAFQLGGDTWKAWNDAVKSAVLKTRRVDEDRKGSWDPVGAGNRVEATAAAVLGLEVYFRYAQVLGAR
jgi:Ca-activated chloride channel family protein